jgi:predicted GNAT family acetyltransferase
LPQYNLEAALGNIEKQRNGQPPEPLPPVTAPNTTALDTLGLSLQRAATANPQDEAKRRKLAGQLGMPTAILPPTPDAESQAFLKNTQAQEIMAKYPALAKWAQNPDNAAVAGKDLPTLGNIEETAKSLPQIALGYGKNLAGSAAAAFPNANAAIWSFVQAAGAILSTNATKPLAERFGTPDVGGMLAETALDMRKRATQIGKDLAPDTSGMGTVERGINSGVQSAATSLMMLPLSLGTGSPVPMLAGLSGITAGQSLGEAIDKGLPLNEALIHATKQGLIEYGTELFPVGNLLKNLTAKTGLIQTATQFMIREGIGEQAATVLQDLDKWATLNPEKPFSEYLAERPEAALETLIATAVGGSIQVGGAKAVAKGLETMQRASTVDLGRAQRAEDNHGILMGLGEKAAGHPLRERDPSAFHDFVSTMTEDGNLSDVYVDGKTLADVLHQSGVSENEINRKMPEVAQQMGEAAKTNGEVRISLADYATYVAGTDVEKGIIDHLRASPEGMTYTEAQQFYQSQKDDLSKQAEKLMSDVNTTEAYKQDVQQVHDTILEQMNKAGRFTADVNAAYAVPFREFYAVQAAKMGILPSELYQRLPLNFAPMNAGNILNQADTFDFSPGIKDAKVGDSTLSYGTEDGALKIYSVRTPQAKRGKGSARAAMEQFLQQADREGKAVTLDASALDKKTSTGKLVKFYESLGFVQTGRKINALGEPEMKREPQVFNQAATAATQTAYENRISELFRGAEPKQKGVKVMDRADVLDMMGYGGEPLYVVERKVSEGMYNHKLTAAQWKKIPQWLDDPAMVLDSDTVPGRLVFVAPEQMKDGTPIIIVVEPSGDKSGAKVNLLVNSYEKSHMPLKKWIDGGLLRYYDKTTSPAILERSGLYLTGLTRARSQSGKIYKDSDLVKYRAANPFDPNILNQSVFHGTPHVWAPEPGFPHGRPRLDKMGSGEGAQAFGWGWYSAENQGVAREYRDMLSDSTDFFTVDGEVQFKGPVNGSDPRQLAISVLARGDTIEAVKERLEDNDADPTWVKQFVAEGKKLEGKKVEIKTDTTGNLYSLDIPDSVLPRLLDWDKPLSEQTPEVREAMKQTGIKTPEGGKFVGNNKRVQEELNGREAYQILAGRLNSDKAASEYLASIGIVGNRYLDGGSRADGKGTYNYVIWDQPTLDKVALLERNGEKLDAIREADMLAQGNRAGYNPDTFTISLLKGADLSSTLHEGGHFYLEALAEMAARPDAPQQIKDDFRKTLDWFGITGNENLGTGVRGGDLGQSPLNVNFWKWFGDSKVVDADGKPLVVYHGTHNDFDQFEIGDEGGVFFTTFKRNASEYAGTFPGMGQAEGGHVIPAYLSIQNPYRQTAAEWLAGKGLDLDSAKEQGYDGFIIEGQDGGDTYVVFRPEQIKSAIGNNGEFSGDTILNQGGEPGTPGDLPPGRTPEEVWNSMSLDQKRPYHEQWAQSFERYMLGGKAPTTEMQPVFARFRAWMLNVYKSLEAFLKQNPLAGKLNDEVRGIFDRLIASEESIRATESVRAYAPLFESNEAAGVTPKQFQDYLDLGEAATERAIDDLSSRSLRDMKWLSNAKERVIKELQKEAKAKRKAVEAEVTQEVMSEPVNQARTFLKTGEMTDPATGDLIKAEAGFKLDRTAVDELFPMKGTVTLDRTKLRGMTQEDGLSPDLAAQMFGFPSGEALIAEIANGESAKDKIEALTDQRMLERYGDLSSEEDIERAAEAAIHNEARARFLATGLAMLSKSPIPAAQLNRAAKQAAENTIASRKVRDLRPAQYERAETKANKEAIKLAPKDPKGAMEAQRAALLNNRLAKASGEAVAEVEKVLRYVEKFNTEGTRKALDLEYLEQIDDLLRPFDFRKGQSLKQIDKRQSLADWIDAQEAMGFEPAIDPALMDEAKLKSYKNMTLEELRGLVDSIKQIEHLGRLKRKLLLAKDQREFDEIVAEGISAIHDNANRTVEEKATPTDAIGIAGKWWRQMTADHRKFASIMREMDGGKDNGFMFNRFLRTMNESGDSETQMKAEATDALAKLFKAIDKNPVPGNLYAKKRVVPGTNLSMTHEQRIMFAMNWGNEGNRQRLLDGGLSGNRAISLPQAQAVLDTLTKEEWDFVQGVWDFIAEYKPQVAALERRITGVEPKWIDPAPVNTKHGTYRGGYFPVKYDTELSSRSESLEAANDLRLGMKGAFNSAATRSGFTKARADQVINRPILLSYNAISQHVSEVTHRLAWQEWLIDTNRLLKALDNPIREHYGAEILRTLRDTVVDIAAGDAPAKNGTETAINRLRVGSTIVGMGWRVTTALLQPSGLAQSWVRVGGKYIARGVYQFTKSPITSGEFVNSKSKMMVDRGRTMQREINEVLNTVRAGDKVSAFKASYFSMIGKMQRAVDIPTWLGAYEKATDQLKLQDAATADERKAIEEQAAALADQAVLDSQSGGQLKDLAKVQRGSPLQKIFTNFYSYFSATYNLNVEAVRRTDFKSPSQVAMLATDMVLLNSVPVLFSVALKEVLKGECGDDLECLGKKLGHEQLSFLFGQMVLLREAGTAIDVAAGGQGFGYQGPAGLRFFGDLYKLGQQTNQADADMAFFKSANNVAGALLHYPAGQINATVEGVMAIEQGKVEGMGILPAIIAGPPKK